MMIISIEIVDVLCSLLHGTVEEKTGYANEFSVTTTKH